MLDLKITRTLLHIQIAKKSSFLQGTLYSVHYWILNKNLISVQLHNQMLLYLTFKIIFICGIVSRRKLRWFQGILLIQFGQSVIMMVFFWAITFPSLQFGAESTGTSIKSIATYTTVMWLVKWIRWVRSNLTPSIKIFDLIAFYFFYRLINFNYGRVLIESFKSLYDLLQLKYCLLKFWKPLPIYLCLKSTVLSMNMMPLIKIVLAVEMGFVERK